eukprot:gnl/TRDRNA2_/TRDRNA2_176932_c0_seq1.p1 gnl/TRDRNA2_/TRDRNA2_176932_c0~~gnl/TRDRNA2_/TRDRNA2_176932_c0_seq1.p1  ORF type:complete len:565 (+),score=68.09 gnl/TRDRNA2_/TRDRNA2_176932_c0_seq1:132-1826(+)
MAQHSSSRANGGRSASRDSTGQTQAQQAGSRVTAAGRSVIGHSNCTSPVSDGIGMTAGNQRGHSAGVGPGRPPHDGHAYRGQVAARGPSAAPKIDTGTLLRALQAEGGTNGSTAGDPVAPGRHRKATANPQAASVPPWAHPHPLPGNRTAVGTHGPPTPRRGDDGSRMQQLLHSFVGGTATHGVLVQQQQHQEAPSSAEGIFQHRDVSTGQDPRRVPKDQDQQDGIGVRAGFGPSEIPGVGLRENSAMRKAAPVADAWSMPWPSDARCHADRSQEAQYLGSSTIPQAVSDGRRRFSLSKDGTIATSTSIAREQNAQFRSYMEDSAVVIDPFPAGDGPGEQWAFYAVYDGHGGSQAVDYCEHKLHDVVLSELRSGRRSSEREALSHAFHRVDEQLKNVKVCPWRCGCTATVVLAHKTPTSLRLHVANVGDSRGVVIDSFGGDWRVSRDHRPCDISEVRRIESEGGFVSRGRVAGQLGVSRSLGDHSLKSSGVTWRPNINVRDATNDMALILASDGLWDVMSDADARQTVQRASGDGCAAKASQLLLDDALRRGSTDNITVLIVWF